MKGNTEREAAVWAALELAQSAITKLWEHSCHVANCSVRTRSAADNYCSGHATALEARKEFMKLRSQ